MAFCPDCGTQNDDNARFCKSCGRPMADVVEARAAMDPAVGTPQSDPAGRMIADDGLPVGQDLDGEPGGERLLWSGKPSKILSPIQGFITTYRLTNERLQIVRGFISRKTEEIDLYRVNDLDMKQTVIERVFGVGDVNLETTDATSPVTTIHNVGDPNRVKDMIRQAARAERQRRRVLLRDEV